MECYFMNKENKMLEFFLEIANKLSYILYIICGILMNLFIIMYIYTDMIKYQALTLLCFILVILFSEITSIIMKKILN